MANKGIIGFSLFHTQGFQPAAALVILLLIREELHQARLEILVGRNRDGTKLNA
jgi:hypothetical protein